MSLTQLRISRPQSRVVSAPADWLEGVAQLSGKTLHVAVCLLWLVSIRRAPEVRLGQASLRRFNTSRDASYDALTRLSQAGRIRVNRAPGRSPVVTLLGRGGAPLKVS
jgi:hypothetical protein